MKVGISKVKRTEVVLSSRRKYGFIEEILNESKNFESDNVVLIDVNETFNLKDDKDSIDTCIFGIRMKVRNYNKKKATSYKVVRTKVGVYISK